MAVGLQLPGAVQPPSVLGGMPAMPDLGQQFGEARAENAAAMKDVEAAKAVQAKVRTEGAQKVGALQANAPVAPEQQPLPDKFQHKPMDEKELNDTVQTMFVMSALGGLMTRQPMTAAMKAFSAGIEGLHKGDQEVFKREAAEFDRNLKLAIEKNHQAVEKYKAAFDRHKGDLQATMQQIQLDAAAANDTVTGALARAQNARGVMQQIQAMARTEAQAQQAQQRFDAQVKRWDQQHQEAMARQGLAEQRLQMQMSRMAGGGAGGGQEGGLTPQAIDMLARQAIADKSVLANLGRGVQGAKDLRAITNRMAEVLETEGGTGMAQRRQEFRADSNSLNKLTQQYDQVTAFEQNAVRNGEQLVALGEKVDATGVPVLEKWIRAGRQATGDPDVAAFNAQMNVYRTEAARIVTQANLLGQLTDTARREIEAGLPNAATAQQVRKVVELFKRDFDNRKHTLEQQMDAIRDRMVKGYGAGTRPGETPQRRSTDKKDPASMSDEELLKALNG